MTSTYSDVYRLTRHTMRQTLARALVALAALVVATALIAAILAHARSDGTLVGTPSISTNTEQLVPPQPRMPGEDY